MNSLNTQLESLRENVNAIDEELNVWGLVDCHAVGVQCRRRGGGRPLTSRV